MLGWPSSNYTAEIAHSVIPFWDAEAAAAAAGTDVLNWPSEKQAKYKTGKREREGEVEYL